MPMRYNYDQYLHGLLQQMERRWNARSLNLGGSPNGAGGPPGGFVGYLPQTRIAYDSVELETDYTPGSGYSMVDNLNHIRYRLAVLESGGGGVGGSVGENEIAFGNSSSGLMSNPNIYVLDSYQTGYKSVNINTNDDAYDYHQYYSLNIGVDPDCNLSNLALWSYGYQANLGFFTANGTEASPTPLASGDEFGLITFYGWSTQYGGSWMNSATIQTIAAENWEGEFPNTKAGSRIEFNVIMPGTTYQRDALKLEWDNATFYQNAQIAIDGGYYFGDRFTDDSFRVTIIDNAIVHQKRLSGNWVTMSGGGGGGGSLVEHEIAYGSPINEITSSPYFINNSSDEEFPEIVIGGYTSYKIDTDILTLINDWDSSPYTAGLMLYTYNGPNTIESARAGGTMSSPTQTLQYDVIHRHTMFGMSPTHTWYNLGMEEFYAEDDVLATTGGYWLYRTQVNGTTYPVFEIHPTYSKTRQDFIVGSGAYYFGDTTTDGSYRIIPSGQFIDHQKKVGGNWESISSNLPIGPSQVAFGSTASGITSNPYVRIVKIGDYENAPGLQIGTSKPGKKYNNSITIIYDNTDVEGETTDISLIGYDYDQSIYFTRYNGTEETVAVVDSGDSIGSIIFDGQGYYDWEGHSTNNPIVPGLGYFEVTALETPHFWYSSDLMTTLISTNSRLAWMIAPSGLVEFGEPSISAAFSVTRDLFTFRDDVQMNVDKAFYIGERNTSGSWRFIVSGNDLLIQKNVAGVWTTKQTISG